MAVEIKLDAALLARIDEQVKAAAMTAMEATKTDLETAQTMPFDTGRMQGTLQETNSRMARKSAPDLQQIRHMPGGCISTRSTISRKQKIRTPAHCGTNHMNPAEEKQILSATPLHRR